MITSLSTLQEQGLQPDIIDDSNPDDIFLGYFRFNKKTLPNYCLIKRVVKENGETKMLFPYGIYDFSYSWADRASYSYRHRDFPGTDVNDGYLYNWLAVSDQRGLPGEGWHIPTVAEIALLSESLGGNALSGGKLKCSGFDYWDDPNTGATNEVGFNGRGSGYRQSDGAFVEQKRKLILTTSLNSYENLILYYNSSVMGTMSGGINGFSVRLIKNDSTNNEMYIGNDGRAYKTVKIGSQVWLADNLAETKFKNGELIQTVTDAEEWTNDLIPAKCAYNNDESNV